MKTVTHLTAVRSTDDRYGKPTYTMTSTDISVIGFAPVVRGEVDGITQTISTDGGTLYLFPGLTVSADDQFIVSGITYDVDGPKAEWQHAFSDWYPGDVVILKRAVIVDG